MVTVQHGADMESAELGGRKVAEVRALYENVFNISPTSIAKVNGRQVDEERVLAEGDKLEFSKTAVKAVGRAA